MISGKRWARCFIACWQLTGCQPATDKLVITGSSTIAPLMAELAERFEAQTGIQVDVQSGGSGRGISDVRQGLADFGMVSRALKTGRAGPHRPPDRPRWHRADR